MTTDYYIDGSVAIDSAPGLATAEVDASADRDTESQAQAVATRNAASNAVAFVKAKCSDCTGFIQLAFKKVIDYGVDQACSKVVDALTQSASCAVCNSACPFCKFIADKTVGPLGESLCKKFVQAISTEIGGWKTGDKTVSDAMNAKLVSIADRICGPWTCPNALPPVDSICSFANKAKTLQLQGACAVNFAYEELQKAEAQITSDAARSCSFNRYTALMAASVATAGAAAVVVL